jgi:putative DNA primase/helicase
LKQDGTKADVEPAKASIGLIAGGAVRLQPCSDTLAVAEGVETSAAAGLLIGMPAWAAVSCGNLGKTMALPASVRSLTIAADHDAPGLRAAEDAALRWRDEGRAVRIIRASRPGADAADILRGDAP